MRTKHNLWICMVARCLLGMTWGAEGADEASATTSGRRTPKGTAAHLVPGPRRSREMKRAVIIGAWSRLPRWCYVSADRRPALPGIAEQANDVKHSEINVCICRVI